MPQGAGGEHGRGAGGARRNADRRKAMNLWHIDCVLQVSRTFDSGLRFFRAAVAVRDRQIGVAGAPHGRVSNFLGAQSFID
jgi:hypothetical protein